MSAEFPLLIAAGGLLMTPTRTIIAASGSGGTEKLSVRFDGANDGMTKSTDLDNNADSKIVTMAFWVRPETSAGIALYWAEGGRINAQPQGSTLFIQGFDTGANIRLNCSSPRMTVGAWNHILFSCDMSDSGKRHFYINDADASESWNTYTNATLDWTRSNHNIGWNGSGNRLTGSVADMWIDNQEYIDFSVEANRRKFVTVAGKPVDLGADGSVPTGTQPLLCFNSPTTSVWNTNVGDGGGFSLIGELSDGPVPQFTP